MSFRTVNGSTKTENGWRCCNRDECDLVRIPDLFLTDTAPLRKGAPLIILGAWLYYYDRNVEEIDSPVWGWSEDNDVLGDWGANMGSNHLGGTAVDVNAPKYNWGDYTMSAALISKVEQGLALFSMDGESGIFWGRRWDKPDEMHYQMAWPEGDPRNDQLAAKLLGGYLGIYKPAPADPTPAATQPPPPAPAPADDAATVLYDAVPVIDEARAAELVGAMALGLAAAQCTNPRRIAMFLAQTGHESDGYNTTVEYGTGQRYAPYIGRTWIQITWQANYSAFGRWAEERDYIDDPDYFVDNPAALGDLKWAGLGAAWYWTVARPDINALSDAGDVRTVTYRINGGYNGLADRQARYNQAIALGDRLLALLPTTTGGFLMALTDDEQQELLTKTREVWDQLRGPQGSGWPQLGTDDQGNDLTPVDAIAKIKTDVAALKPIGKPSA